MSLVKHESKAVSSSSARGRKGGKRKRGGAAAPPPKKRKTQVVSDNETEKAALDENAVDEVQEAGFEQPALVTGGTLKSYQLEGVAWMVTLWKNGISGILGTR